MTEQHQDPQDNDDRDEREREIDAGLAFVLKHDAELLARLADL
ncbi:hypothetical protein [Arthrobacter sp. zg-Y1110]|nr:hypothetical protein [Arthrobacter sp. zg-Y1110]UWX85631.1 hypothetical protein N2K99_03515 [Arthrobacter sp. zg-Y1110]